MSDQVKENNTKSPGIFARIADKFLHGKGIFTFLRSSVSSQLASWTDMGVAFIFYAFVFLPLDRNPLRTFLATAIGLIVGGIVNCIVNYKFTFQAKDCPIKAVAVKYLLIWGGSFILNLLGTTLFDQLLQSLEIHRYVSWIKPDGVFAIARLTVSLIVSLAWNFLFQKTFVYVPTRFDKYAINLVDRLTFKKTNKQKRSS